MSLSEEPIGDGPSSDSFWEINQYRRTVRRCDNAHKLATELANCIQERAEIEKSYAAKWVRLECQPGPSQLRRAERDDKWKS